MLTKAIITGISKNNPNKYIVRIPVLDGWGNKKTDTPDKELSEATLCCLPGISNPVNINDIVYVDFEDNNLARPVILGHLYLGVNGGISDRPQTSIGLNLSNLSVEDKKSLTPGTAKLPVGTSIGDISYNDLENIKKFWQQWEVDKGFNFANTPWGVNYSPSNSDEGEE